MPAKLKRLVLKELSLVDRPANTEAVVTIFKRGEPLIDRITKFCCDGNDYKGAKSFVDVLACTEARERYWKAYSAMCPLMDALSESVRSVVADAAMTAQDKEDNIRSNLEAFMTKLRDTLPDAEEALTKFADDLISGALNKGDSIMPDTKTELDLANDKIAELTKRTETAELMAKATDDEKAFMKEMDDDKKKEFMSLKPEERTEKMRVSKAADEVMVVDGTEVRKSAVGDAMFNVLKSQQKRLDAQAADVAKAQEQAEMATLRKRADDDFSHLPGSVDERASVLKAMSAMDEATRNSLEAILKAGEKALKAGFDRFGSSVSKGEDTAMGELDKLTKAYMKEHNVSEAVAYDAVIQKNAGLYERALKEGN